MMTTDAEETLDAGIIIRTMIRNLLECDNPALAPNGLELFALVLIMQEGYSIDELAQRFGTVTKKDPRFRFQEFFNGLLVKMHRASDMPVPAHLLVKSKARLEFVKPPALDTKRCVRCGREKSRSLFYLSSKCSDGLNSWCIACHKETAQERKLQARLAKRQQAGD